MNEPIIVGVDGSPASAAAVEWAVREGGIRGLPVRLVHVAAGPRDRQDAGAEESGRAFLNEALRLAGSVRARVTVTGDVVPGHPVGALVTASAAASMLVTGSRGLGAVPGLVLGSVSRQVAEYAASSVVIVPEPRTVAYHEIVVGTDGSDPAARAVDFAFEEAAAREASLRVVHAVQPVFPLLDDLGTGGPEALRTATDLLRGRLKPWTDTYPGVRVHAQVVPGHAAYALTAAALRADLLVIGCRGGGGFHGLRLGSVSQGALSLCRTPAAIIR